MMARVGDVTLLLVMPCVGDVILLASFVGDVISLVVMPSCVGDAKLCG